MKLLVCEMTNTFTLPVYEMTCCTINSPAYEMTCKMYSPVYKMTCTINSAVYEMTCTIYSPVYEMTCTINSPVYKCWWRCNLFCNSVILHHWFSLNLLQCLPHIANIMFLSQVRSKTPELRAYNIFKRPFCKFYNNYYCVCPVSCPVFAGHTSLLGLICVSVLCLQDILHLLGLICVSVLYLQAILLLGLICVSVLCLQAILHQLGLICVSVLCL